MNNIAYGRQAQADGADAAAPARRRRGVPAWRWALGLGAPLYYAATFGAGVLAGRLAPVWSCFAVLLLGATAAVGFLRGGRFAAQAMLVITLSNLVTDIWPESYEHALRPITTGLDVVQLVALSAIALRSRGWWALWVAAFQLLSLTMDLLRLFDADFLPFAHYAASTLMTWSQQTAIAIGVLRARRQGLED